VASSNLEIVERGFEAFNAEGIDGILPFIHPDFEATTPPDLATEPDTYRGHEGVRRWFSSFDEVMDEIRWDARGFREAGDLGAGRVHPARARKDDGTRFRTGGGDGLAAPRR
jgi:ketosteroid isomerase-like protein